MEKFAKEVYNSGLDWSIYDHIAHDGTYKIRWHTEVPPFYIGTIEMYANQWQFVSVSSMEKWPLKAQDLAHIALFLMELNKK